MTIPEQEPDDPDWWVGLGCESRGPLQGVATAGVPSAWLEPLLFAGMPLAPEGELRWGRDLQPQAAGPIRQQGDRLLLPADPESLSRCNGVDLKPLRRWCAQRLGLRLQAAPGLAFFLWQDHALVQSSYAIDLAGFLHGPRRGQRHVLAIPAGGTVVLRF